MHKQNILIPGGGGAAGVGAIKSLRMCGFQGKIISTDANPLSAGLYLADVGYVLPLADHHSFFEQAMNVIKKEEINVILPTSGFDIVPYSKNKNKLENIGVVSVISDYEVLETCLNKKKFYETLKNDFDLPYTTTSPNNVDDFPCIVKPIFGKGSKNVFLCRNESELIKVVSEYEDMIIQEYLPNKEYTIDVLSDMDGNPLIAVPRERIEVKAGISFKGKIVLDKNIKEQCLQIAKILGIKGPSCMQMKGDINGVPKIMEVNPRMGGGTIMATYAGANFPELILKMVGNENFTIPHLKSITMVRYYEEIILNNKNEEVKV